MKILRVLYFTSFLFISQVPAIAQSLCYFWPLPEKWVKELIPFPLKFAPELDYPGVEEIHFMPGWREPEHNDETWCYMFVWALDTLIRFNPTMLEKDLTIYFDGLTGWVIKNTGSAANIQSSVICINSSGNNVKPEFSGTVTFFDVFFSHRVITLNIRIFPVNPPGPDKTAIFFLLSPHSFRHNAWKTMERHITEFHFTQFPVN